MQADYSTWEKVSFNEMPILSEVNDEDYLVCFLLLLYLLTNTFIQQQWVNSLYYDDLKLYVGKPKTASCSIDLGTTNSLVAVPSKFACV
jgi:hypothetical protein